MSISNLHVIIHDLFQGWMKQKRNPPPPDHLSSFIEYKICIQISFLYVWQCWDIYSLHYFIRMSSCKCNVWSFIHNEPKRTKRSVWRIIFERFQIIIFVCVIPIIIAINRFVCGFKWKNLSIESFISIDLFFDQSMNTHSQRRTSTCWLISPN